MYVTTRNGQFTVMAVVTVMAGLVMWFVFSEDVIKNAPPKGDVIVAFGDSLTVGVGARPLHDYPSLISERLGKPIINAGKSGDTTAQALARLDEDVLALRPDVVIVLLGGNDLLQNVQRDITFSNLRTIITKIQDTGAVVVLVGIRGGFPLDPYAESFEKLHSDLEVAFVPNIMADVITRAELMSEDRIHPNDAGYAVFFDKLYPVIASLYE